MAGVEEYAEFLPWCVGARVDESSRRMFDNGDRMFEADLMFDHDQMGNHVIRHRVMMKPNEMIAKELKRIKKEEKTLKNLMKFISVLRSAMLRKPWSSITKQLITPVTLNKRTKMSAI